jgi:leucyl/phenylalanyl-tRNA--protein transferase
MFSRETDASKVALAYLVALLKKNGFVLLDTQFVTDHLTTFGVEEVPRDDFHVLLAEAMKVEAQFGVAGGVEGGAAGGGLAAADVLQLITHTS